MQFRIIRQAHQSHVAAPVGYLDKTAGVNQHNADPSLPEVQVTCFRRRRAVAISVSICAGMQVAADKAIPPL